jgi:hypothetical protein
LRRRGWGSGSAVDSHDKMKGMDAALALISAALALGTLAVLLRKVFGL